MTRRKLYDDETTVVSFRLPVPMKKEIERIARVEYRTLSQQIVVLIRRGIEAMNSAPPESRARSSR